MLNTPRQLKNNDKSWTQCFISSHINDQGLSSGGNGAGVNYPLYQFKHPNYTENFTPEFRSFIDKHYNHSFEPLEVLGIFMRYCIPHITASVMKSFSKPITLKSFSQTIKICLGF